MNDLEKLKKYLLYDDVSIVENEIFEIIPELKHKKILSKKVNGIHLMYGIIR